MLIIETRTPATEERAAGPWHSDGMGDGLVLVETVEEAQEAIAGLRAVGLDWDAAEYRWREVTSRELVAMVRARGGAHVELAGILEGLLDEADRMAAQQLRRRGGS